MSYEREERKIKQLYKNMYVKRCENCNEEFDMYPCLSTEWVYKIITYNSTKYFCTWSCQMKYEEERRKKKNEKRL